MSINEPFIVNAKPCVVCDPQGERTHELEALEIERVNITEESFSQEEPTSAPQLPFLAHNFANDL